MRSLPFTTMAHIGASAVVVALLLAGCSAGADVGSAPPSGRVGGTPAEPGIPDVLEHRNTPDVQGSQQNLGSLPPALATDGRPRRADLSIPALGLRELAVVPYAGRPDDAPGTAIQDAGDLASPHGTGGLVGPGGIGNYLVTGHRSSSTRPFAALPALPVGSRVVLRTRTHRLVYEIVRDQRTSFRSRASLRAQAAAVPGRPGRAASRAMITLSTCATPEDHAVGNYWSDEFHNPEHRLEKIGVLRSLAPR